MGSSPNSPPSADGLSRVPEGFVRRESVQTLVATPGELSSAETSGRG